jgi:hypothetical protein
MGCCAGKAAGSGAAVKEGAVGAAGASPRSNLNVAGPARSSFKFRGRGNKDSSFGVKWGVDAHSVNSEYRKRRLSDQSLALVMADSTILKELLAFTDNLGATSIVRLWLDLNDFEIAFNEYEQSRGGKGSSSSVHNNGGADGDASDASSSSLLTLDKGGTATANKSALLGKANRIYGLHLRPNCCERRLLEFFSQTTLQDAATALQVDANGNVTSTSLATVADVMRTLHLRAHNVMKYEFLPVFLASPYFLKLANPRDEDGGGGGAGDAAAINSDLALLGSALARPHGDSELEEASLSRAPDGDTPSQRSDVAALLDAGDLIKDVEKSRFFFEFIYTEAKRLPVAEPNEPQRSPAAGDGGAGSNSRLLGSRGSSASPKAIMAASDSSDLSVASAASPSRADAQRRRRRTRDLQRHLEVVELFLELEDLLDNLEPLDAAAKLKRLNRILHRYGSPVQDLIHPPVFSLQDMFHALCTGAGGQATTLPAQPLEQLFAPVRVEVLNRIQTRIVPAFKRSNAFKQMEVSRRHTMFQHSEGGEPHLEPENPEQKPELGPEQQQRQPQQQKQDQQWQEAESPAIPVPVKARSASMPPRTADAVAAHRQAMQPLVIEPAVAPPPLMPTVTQVKAAPGGPPRARTAPTEPAKTREEALEALADARGRTATAEQANRKVGGPANIEQLDRAFEAHDNRKSQTANNISTLLKHGTDAHQVGLNNFTAVPSLTASGRTRGRLGLDELLASSFGQLQLKRFARRLFQEENITFLVHAAQIRDNAPVSRQEDFYELVHKAQTVCDVYIREGSPSQVNISATQRSKTLETFNSLQTSFVDLLKESTLPGEERERMDERFRTDLGDLFSIVQAEVKGMVSHGLLQQFYKDKLYEDFLRKHDRAMRAHSSEPSHLPVLE